MATEIIVAGDVAAAALLGRAIAPTGRVTITDADLASWPEGVRALYAQAIVAEREGMRLRTPVVGGGCYDRTLGVVEMSAAGVAAALEVIIHAATARAIAAAAYEAEAAARAAAEDAAIAAGPLEDMLYRVGHTTPAWCVRDYDAGRYPRRHVLPPRRSQSGTASTMPWLLRLPPRRQPQHRLPPPNWRRSVSGPRPTARP